MTKQEQIEEINEILRKKGREWLDDMLLSDNKPNLYDMEACAIFNAGYRKADEVRNETAKEILKAVDDESNGQTISITNVLRKKYSVKVEK